MIIINYIAIVVIVVAAALGLRYYLTKDDGTVVIEDELEIDMDLKYLIDETKHFFTNVLSQNFEDANLTREELLRKNRRKNDLSRALHNSKYGDKDAKRLVLGYIKDLLSKDKYDIENNIDKFIRFDDVEKMSGNDVFAIVLYLYERQFDNEALDKLISDFKIAEHLEVDANGLNTYKLTTERIKTIYTILTEKRSNKVSVKDVELDYNDKLTILAQRVFERYLGLSVVDKLFEQKIDEIDVGVSGVPAGSFMKRVTAGDKSISYSYDSVWILYHGINIRLECLGFQSQNELIRVCNNIYKYDAPYVMSRNESRVLATMIDGSRILVVRPPVSSSYAFFLRKFDTASGTTLDALITQDKYKYIPICLMKWFISGQRNCAITGQQGTGKTTSLAAVIRYIDPLFNIRVQEMQHELNLRFTYPERNVVELQETEVISAQEILNLTKKMNGAVTIIGEVASAIQASHIIQTAMVGSLFTLFTHHAKTTVDWVNAIADNLLQIGLYHDKKDAVRATAGVLRIDCHMAMIKGHRHIERITEVIPVEDTPYPSVYQLENVTTKYIAEHTQSISIEDQKKKVLIDTPEFYKRMTDPELFTTRQIIHWESDDDEGITGHFVLDNLPTEKLMNEMLEAMPAKEGREFKADMQMLVRLAKGENVNEKEKEEWVHKVYSY